MADKPTEQVLTILIPEKSRGGRYSNLVIVNASKNEVTLNFVYVNVGDEPQGTLVSRVILSRDKAQEFCDVLKNVIRTSHEVDPS